MNYTYNVVFNDDQNSNDKGWSESKECCVNYIKQHNGTNESYFADYKGGTVEVVCNESGETVYAEMVR